MKQLWLNNKNNSKLIVFFNGWGMDEKIISNISFDDYDFYSVCDYTNLEGIKADFSNYRKKILICWSMGVYVSNYYYEIFDKFDRLIAINGTQKPIDDSYGIPVKIYNLMIDNFNEHTVSRFMKKMTLTDSLNNYQSRSDEELKQELIAIKNMKISQNLKYDKVILSLQDKIIPTKNQINYWKERNIQPIMLDLPHYIFDKYSGWSEII